MNFGVRDEPLLPVAADSLSFGEVQWGLGSTKNTTPWSGESIPRQATSFTEAFIGSHFKGLHSWNRDVRGV